MVISLTASAEARGKPSKCEPIKPEQQLTVERQQELDAAIQAGLRGVGSTSSSVSSEQKTSYSVQMLSEDALARSWYTYQLCVLKDVGAISESMHEELMRSVWGLPSESEARPSPMVGLAGQELSAETAVVAVGSTSEVPSGDRFIPADGKATVVIACAEPRPDNKGVTHTYRWSDGSFFDADSWTAVAHDVSPGRVEVSVWPVKSTLELQVESGGVYYIAGDVTQNNLVTFKRTLELVDAHEGRARLDLCKKHKRK